MNAVKISQKFFRRQIPHSSLEQNSFPAFCINSRGRVSATLVFNEYSQFKKMNFVCFSFELNIEFFCINSNGRVRVPFSWRQTKLLNIITISSRPLQTWVTLQNKFPLCESRSCRYLGAKHQAPFELGDWNLKL